MVLVIDNYDSFVYNLARYVSELGLEVNIVRNDAITIEQIAALRPSHIIISPGPCTPNEAGISLALIQHYQQHVGTTTAVPILRVCLGHQAIGQAFGGNVIRAKHPTHSKDSEITHSSVGIFAGIPSPFKAARYHSLIVCQQTLPANLLITASSEHGEIMALQHASLPIFGVQFHPESILTEHGYTLLQNFLQISC